jgi:hypothetical protein
MNILLLLCFLSEPINSQSIKPKPQFPPAIVSVSKDIKYYKTGILDFCMYDKSNYIMSDTYVAEFSSSCPSDNCLNKSLFPMKFKSSIKPLISEIEVRRRINSRFNMIY